MKCRFCKTNLNNVFIDLFNSPASNSFITKEQLYETELFFPLKVFTCSKCFLVQLEDFKKSDTIFDKNYAYFSSYSTTWLEHSKRYAHMITERFGYNSNSQIIEVASNDGYLLQYFKEKNIPVLGIDPAANTAEVARKKGIESVIDFFGVKLAKNLVAKGIQADLLVGNNVLAHVPDIVDFVGGMKIILKKTGVITLEFPHLMQLIEKNQFDTIYQEHYSYLSFFTVKKIFESQGLVLFDVDEIPTHGGSIRIYAKHKNDKTKKISDNVYRLLEKEKNKGMRKLTYYNNFQQKALKIKIDFIDFLIKQKKLNKKVIGYGAAAKGNTLLNYCGIRNDFIDYVVDASLFKQNKFLPASHIPVVSEEYIKKHKPDYVVIFPWNLEKEITAQLSYIRKWNGKFVVTIPKLRIF